MKTIFKIESGSKMYGTSHPESDTDYKSVHLPSYRDIIMMKTQNVVKKSTGGEHVKNTKEDVDDESYVLRKFFDMVIQGDMVAQELLFVSPEKAIFANSSWELIHENRRSLVDKNIKGFVGYIRRQTNTYSSKGHRVEAVRKFVEYIDLLISKHSHQTKLRDVPNIRAGLENFVNKYEAALFVDMPKSFDNTQNEEYFELVNRKVSYNVSLTEVHKLFTGVLKGYGARSLAAETNEGVDWKSVYHAVRVSEQALELLEFGEMTFPRPNAQELLKIRFGEYRYEQIGEILENNLNKLTELGKTTSLPETVDIKLIDDIIFELHSSIVIGEK